MLAFVLYGAAVVVLLAANGAQATAFPFGFDPQNPPFFDQCMGMTNAQCKNNKQCSWATTVMPQCTLTARANVRAPNAWKAETTDLVSKFFTFYYGMHLTEGKTDRRYYNVDVNECASLCLRSAAGLSDATPETMNTPTTTSRRRCASFDYFPFEAPKTLPPHGESMTRGICILNRETRLSARLRQEDGALTDAELFYLSSPLYRPFSRHDGYYEINDQRGLGMIGTLDSTLNIASDPDGGSGWGQSRNGFVLLKHAIKRQSPLDCSSTLDASMTDDSDPARTFIGGFGPTNRDGSCPGLVTKAAAETLCRDAGGSLCATQAIVRSLDNVRLGCNFDGQSIWSQEDTATYNVYKYVRCCASFVDIPDCFLYSKTNVDFCSSKASANECQGAGSGFNLQVEKGFGRLLEDYRSRCEKAVEMGVTSNCRQMLMQGWTPRDRCVWCPAIGNTPGQCRPGNDFGICPISDKKLRETFITRVTSVCPQKDLCELFSHPSYGDLPILFNPIGGAETGATPSPVVQSSEDGGNCAAKLPCSHIKGKGSRGRCKMRSDCKWQRRAGNLSKVCVSK